MEESVSGIPEKIVKSLKNVLLLFDEAAKSTLIQLNIFTESERKMPFESCGKLNEQNFFFSFESVSSF